MSNWYYYDNADRKQGPFSGGQLRQLVQQGIIVPETTVETEEGKTTPARKIRGLTFPEATPPVETAVYGMAQPEPSTPSVDSNPFSAAMPSPFVQTVPVPPPVADLFCTNCGQSISAQAVACMSCGAKPVGHKKFCRQCGTGLNPEQVICVKCGTKITAGYANVVENLSTAFIPEARRMAESVLSSSNVEKIKRVPQPVIITAIIVVAVLGLFFLSRLFSSGSNDPALVGKWELGPGRSTYGIIENMELLKDGTGIVDKMGVTWKTKSGRLYLTASLGAQAYAYKKSRSWSTLTLTDDHGKSTKYWRQRK